MMRKLGAIVMMTALSLLYPPAHVLGAEYPTKPITIINPMAPGGGHDIVARGFAAAAEKYLGQPLVVTYKPGATGMIGGLAGAQAAPDGYTITVNSTNVNATTEWEIANGRKPPFTRHDYTPIAGFTIGTTVVIVPNNSPWKTLSDFIKDGKAKPGRYAFGSAGMYGMGHWPYEILARATGVKLRHIPYAGGGPALNAVVGGHVDMSLQWPSNPLPLIQGGKVRALAVQSEERLRTYPDTPTCKELGIDAVWYGWVGIVVPQKTPMPIVQKLRDVAKKVGEDKAFLEMLDKAGEELRLMVGDDLGKFMELEAKRLSDIMTYYLKENPPK
jgi:tripartite-type tricarboxylate transporter receptor subunit TctC